MARYKKPDYLIVYQVPYNNSYQVRGEGIRTVGQEFIFDYYENYETQDHWRTVSGRQEMEEYLSKAGEQLAWIDK